MMKTEYGILCLRGQLRDIWEVIKMENLFHINYPEKYHHQLELQLERIKYG